MNAHSAASGGQAFRCARFLHGVALVVRRKHLYRLWNSRTTEGLTPSGALRAYTTRAMKKAELVLQTQTNALMRENGLLISPRPSVDRNKLEESLREALRLLHVDLDDENLRDTPRRWAESMITLTSGYDFRDVKRLTTLFRKACSSADESCQNLVVIGGTYKTLCAHHILPF